MLLERSSRHKELLLPDHAVNCEPGPSDPTLCHRDTRSAQGEGWEDPGRGAATVCLCHCTDRVGTSRLQDTSSVRGRIGLWGAWWSASETALRC